MGAETLGLGGTHDMSWMGGRAVVSLTYLVGI